MEREVVYQGRRIVVRTFARGRGKRWSWSFTIDAGSPVPNRNGPLDDELKALDDGHQAAIDAIDNRDPG